MLFAVVMICLLRSCLIRCWLLLAISTSTVLLRQCGGVLLISPCSNAFTRGQFWPSGIVVACAFVCVPVCSKHELARTITCPFELESQNLDQKCKTLWIRSLFFFLFYFIGGGAGGVGGGWVVVVVMVGWWWWWWWLWWWWWWGGDWLWPSRSNSF